MKAFRNLQAHQSKTVPEVWWTIHKQNGDDRGSLTEAAVEDYVVELGGQRIRQVNMSLSKPMVLRGMHVHKEQMDAWYIAAGIAQVAVQNIKTGEQDMRILHPSMGVIIPPGIGHGFLCIDHLALVYAVSNVYANVRDEWEYQAEEVQGWKVDLDDALRSPRDLNGTRRKDLNPFVFSTGKY